MTELIVSFILGLGCASALAQVLPSTTQIFPVASAPSIAVPIDSIFMAGRAPDGHASVVQVDRDGYVICSPERKPTKPEQPKVMVCPPGVTYIPSPNGIHGCELR